MVDRRSFGCLGGCSGWLQLVARGLAVGAFLEQCDERDGDIDNGDIGDCDIHDGATDN
jgi:hypothetical protein